MQRPAPLLAVLLATLHSPLATPAMATQAEATSEAPSKGPVVLGLDLSEAPQTRNFAKLPDLYEADPKHPGQWKSTAGVYQAPLDERAWLKFPAAKNRYYIEYRDDRDKPETERTYGPFEGDPFEHFALEGKMAARLTNDALAADDTYRIELMLRHGDRHLHGRAFRLMQVALSDDVPGPTRAGYLMTFHGFLEEYAEPIAAHPTSREDAAKLAARLDEVAKTIDDLTLEFPREEYAGPDPSVMATVREDDWGEVLEGLRFAAAPESRSVNLGEEIAFHLVVENASKKSIKFSASDLLQGSRAEICAADGRPIDVRSTWYSGVAPIVRYWLEPGERVVLARPTVKFQATPSDGQAPGQCQAIVEAGEYRVNYSIGLGMNSAWFRQDDGVMRRAMPAKGEWRGSLKSASIPLAVEP